MRETTYFEFSKLEKRKCLYFSHEIQLLVPPIPLISANYVVVLSKLFCFAVKGSDFDNKTK